MQHRTPSCQLGAPSAPVSRVISPREGDTQCLQHTLVHGTARQSIEHTASRRTGPRRWLRAVQWLIAAGLHPKANTTTMRVAEDLAARMDYDTGHARYCLDETAARLGVSRATVKRHVAYLRELGALAWVQHGTRTNIRRLMGLKGYAATATVYAAVIPAVFDHAMGHRIIGTGYTARVIIDQRGHFEGSQDCKTTPKAPSKTPVDTPGNSPVENADSEGLEPPSLTLVKEESQVQLVGGFNYTEQARPPKARIPHQSSLINGRRRTATDVQKASNETRLVRALVNWTQSVPLRKLEHALRPWTDRGWDPLRIADELNGMCAGVRWKPKNPVAFIRARITKQLEQEQLLVEQEAAPSSMENQAWRDWMGLEKLFAASAPEQEPVRTDQDREQAQMYGWRDLPSVLAHYEEDHDDAIDLYGVRLCQVALSQTTRLEASYA